MIVKDQINEVISLLQENLSALHAQISEAELLQFKARLNNIDREKNLGIIPIDRYRIERNQLRQILIEKITNLEKEQHKEKAPESKFPINDGDLLLEEASTLTRDGEYRKAEELLQSALDKPFKKYDKAEVYSMLGNIYNKMDYFQDAIDAYQKALELDPNSAIFWTNLGIVYRLTAQYDKAEECYKKALVLDPDYPQLYTSLGALHLTYTMKFDEAIRYLEKAIELDPSQAVTYANMAVAKASIGQFAEAEVLLKMAAIKGYKNTKNAKAMIENLKHL